MIRRPAVPCDVCPARSLERAGCFLFSKHNGKQLNLFCREVVWLR